MAHSKRGNPVARVGNYASEVDTTGMDPEDKRALGFGEPKKPAPRKSFFKDAIKGLLKGRPKKR